MWRAKKDIEAIESAGLIEVRENLDSGEYGDRVTRSDRNGSVRHACHAFTVLVGYALRNSQDSRPRFGIFSKRTKHYKGLGVT